MTRALNNKDRLAAGLWGCTVLVLLMSGAFQADGGEAVEAPHPSVRGAHVAVELVPMRDKFQDRAWQVLDLFDATPDSTAWFGPNKPNPHSWLGPSVYCSSPSTFQFEIATVEGDSLETLDFNRVEPGFYRVVAEHLDAPGSRPFLFRFRQDERPVAEHRLVLRGGEREDVR